MLDEKTRERIINEETGKFLDDRFAPLDRSGIIDLRNLPPEDNALEDRHGFSRVITSGTNGLKAFLENPDSESLDRLANEMGDDELRTKLAEGKATFVAKDFVNRN